MMKIIASIIVGILAILYFVGAFVTAAALKEFCHGICHEN